MNATSPSTSINDDAAAQAPLDDHAGIDELPTLQRRVDRSMPASAGWASDFFWRRVAPVVLLLSTTSVLVVASLLTPDGQGVGTHTQMGLPPCGALTTTGLPCATCGMTTAFAWAAQGNLVRSVIVQPAGGLLAMLCAMGGLVSGWALIRGMSLRPLAQTIWQPRPVLIFAGVVLAAWGYKVALALMEGQTLG